MTRFQKRDEKVVYEIAQVKLIVENQSPASDGFSIERIAVYPEEKVSSLKKKYDLINNVKNRKIMTKITATGLVFATLSLDAPSFEEYFVGLEDLTNKVDFTCLSHRRSISYEGRFNWKTM